ncbi:MAG: prolyl oligopeptidase family serine peptidase [Polyangiaceae bacterium]|nr:prolyl oligopeptidase family serine peptidase [Polyangiaceae bacterium]
MRVRALILLACSLPGCSSESKPTGGGSGGASSGDPYYDAVPASALSGELASCGSSLAAPPSTGQHSGFASAGQQRSFWLALPPATFTGPRPTLVLFNGTGETGQGIFARAQAQAFVDRGFVVIAPDSNANGTLWPVWDGLRLPGDESLPNADLEFFDQLLSCVAAHLALDEKRLYVAGHSAGGIFTNHVLQRRSALLAGGLPASGVFDLTGPSPQTELDSMAVLVTWGGDNDSYSGSSGAGVAVPNFSFVEQAAIASAHYSGQPSVTQAWCQGADLGHAWLSPVNDWMIDFLLAHPKGLAGQSPWQLAQPTTSAASCGTDVVPLPAGTEVVCAESTKAGCQSYCQFLGDCAAENATVEPVLGPQLDALGFSGPGHTSCTGCLGQCASDASHSSDAGVLSCLDQAFGSAVCEEGITGVLPFVNAANACCDGKLDSGVCTRLCQTINTNSAAANLFPTCAAWN